MNRIPLLFFAGVIAACGEPLTPAPKPVQKALPAVKTAIAPTIPAPTPVAVAAPEPAPDPNRLLAQRVMRALEGEAKIHAAAIDVTASGGVVTLWGTAATNDEKIRAGRVAYRVIGVTAVDNKLAIASGS